MSQTRAERLKQETTTTHEKLDAMIMAAEPFASLANYARFLRMQHALHRDVAPLYLRDDLAAVFPALADMPRAAAVEQDLRDLGQASPDYTRPPVADILTLPQALGWLYVVEGSNLGAAFLFKAAKRMGLNESHGARHLAEAPEGRAAHWRAFKDALNAADLDEGEEQAMIEAARMAFDRVRVLAASHLAAQAA